MYEYAIKQRAQFRTEKTNKVKGLFYFSFSTVRERFVYAKYKNTQNTTYNVYKSQNVVYRIVT